MPTQPQPTSQARAYCYRCDKAESMCICRFLEPVENKVGIHILQHPRERRHALGTTRLLRLGLTNVKVHVLDLVGSSSVISPIDLPKSTGLLYLGDGARELEGLAQGERPENLVVIDGTWAQAHRLHRENPWLSSLPCYRLSPTQASRYRIRTEPRHECLSTVESVVAALVQLQPDIAGTETLSLAFDAMIDAQIEASKNASTHAPRTRKSARVSKGLPRVMLAPDANLVVVYSELEPKRGTDRSEREPMRLSAASLDGRFVFDQLIQTSTAPDAYAVGQMELTESDLASALGTKEVLGAFRESLAEGSPVLLVWNVRTYRWLKTAFPDLPCVLLKGIWANRSRAKVPELSVLVRSLGLTPEALPVSGRAGRRLTLAHQMARHLIPSEARAG